MAPYKKYKKQSPSTRFLSQSAKALVTAQAALKLATQIKGLVNVEKHRHLLTTTATNITQAGTMLDFNLIAQGDNQADRQGNSILVKGISSKLNIIGHSSSAHTSIRIVWFIDQQQVADSSPAVTDVLEAATVTAPINLLNVGRFKILKQKFINFSNAGQQQALVNQFIKLNHHVRYNGTTSTDIQKGGIYMFILSDEATSYPNFTADQVVQFYDN